MKRLSLKRICKFPKSLTRLWKNITRNKKLRKTLAFASIPYYIWLLFVPFIPLGKYADAISNKLRSILEKQKAKHFIGLNLASILVVFSIIPFTQIQSQSFPTNIDVVLSAPEQSVQTEETFQMPVPGYLSQHFGWLHHGIDIAGNNGVAVYPITNGIVKEIAFAPFGYGLEVVIDHGNGIVSRYAHLQIKNVELNQKVTKHDILGFVGSTGWSTGPHLHLEVYQNNRSVNPFAYIPSKYSEEFKIVATNNTNIVTKGNTDNNKVASMAAQVEYKEIAQNFQDPNWFNESTPSATVQF